MEKKQLETLDKEGTKDASDDGDAAPAMKSRKVAAVIEEPEKTSPPKPAGAPSAPPLVAPAPGDRPARRRPMVDGRSSIAADNDDGEQRASWPPKDKPAALQGELATISTLIAKRDTTAALAAARGWHAREPSNVLAWIGLGETLEARKELSAAARAYGSIIDLFPGRGSPSLNRRAPRADRCASARSRDR